MVHLIIGTVPSESIYLFQGNWKNLVGERQYADVMVHAIALLNRSSQVLSVRSIIVEGTERGRLLQRVVFDREEIQQWVKPVVARDGLGLRRLVDLILGTDRVAPPEMVLSSSTELEPGHVLLVPSVYLMFHKRPDKVTVSVQVDGDGEQVQTDLNVVEYTKRVTYGFPLEGTWLMKGMPHTGVLDHHRFGVSSEFGVDLLCLGPQGQLFRNEGKQASDYYSYGQRVLAAAEGQVAAVNTAQIQEWSRFNPIEGETEEQFQDRQLRQIRQAIQGDVGKWAAGNYVVIEHAPAEYSAYLHLKENSVRVKEGDVVQRAQHIADVGNTGDSFGAHLHFQVMDRPDLVCGKSLPFKFGNVEVTLSEPGWFVHSLPLD